jgi:hypothetical protein
MRRRIAAVTFVMMLLVPLLSCAAAGIRVPRSSDQQLVDVRIIGDNRGELAGYRTYPAAQQRGGEYYYLEAYNGERYSVQVTNRSSRRIGVVVAVDGRNIVSGEKSYLTPSERMYILDAYETSTFEGWRTGLDQTHRFYFTEQKNSYAERAFADGSAMGTIALAIYAEDVPPPPPPAPIYRRDKGAMDESVTSSRERAAGGAKAESAPQAGTGYGESTYSPVRIVQFKPESVLSQKVVFKYEWRQELCKKGVLSCGEKNRMWSQENEGFAPPPRDAIR